MKKKSNMYGDSVKQWNVFVGCNYDCTYCKKSFQAQMRRQIHNCEKCGNYVPHFHKERLNASLPRTMGDEFIWVCSSGDISFAKREWIEQILERVREMPDKTFFFQSKNPFIFKKYDFPNNTLLGTTIETNRQSEEYIVSKAPPVFDRYIAMTTLEHRRKVVTIEPIMDFDYWTLFRWIKAIKPERVYIGYDTRKSHLPEPDMPKVMKLIKQFRNYFKVKLKYLPDII